MVAHRAGIWKQSNKGHKTGRHRSKGQIEIDNKGRRASVKSLTKKFKSDVGRTNRRNTAKQIRTKKKQDVIAAKRGLGGTNAPPHLVAIVPLHRDANVEEVIEKIKLYKNDEGLEIVHNTGFSITVPKLKKRFTFIVPASSNLADVIDCTLVADTILFVLSKNASEPIDYTGKTFLSNIFANGLSASVLSMTGLSDVPIKKKSEVKKGITKQMEQYFPNCKLLLMDTTQEVQIVLRTIADQKSKPLMLRRNRPYMMSESFEYKENDNSSAGELHVTGYVRSECFDVNRLVHIVGWGDYQIKQINTAKEILQSLTAPQKSNKSMEVEMDSVEVLATSDPELRQDLNTQAEVNPLDAEQTWPTEEEIKESEEAAAAAEKVKKLKKRVPKGTSEYQAAWILDSDNDWSEVSDEEDENDEFQPMNDEDSQMDEEEEIEELESVSGAIDTASQYDEQMQFEDDMVQLKRFKEERSNEQFPDEMDTPYEGKAKDRFQKYRGLKSFRTSPWDAKENLPLDYAKIFQFKDFNRTRKRVRALENDDRVAVGMYVTIVIENVPKSFVDAHPENYPLSLFGLFPHEQKMSVVHIALKRMPGLYEDMSIKNKDELLFHVGFRRFRVRPIFSEHTSGNKHKMERFFPKEGVVIASFYGQILFPPANVLVFKEKSSEILPVASGTMYSVNPDRIITKRIVLSGHPFRINKKSATVRYMFFNREDILWFKPVELRTKWGRRGHIKDALGTHGHMKCVFDSQLISQDTVLMNLYKRVFPKWNYDIITPLNKVKMTMDSESGSIMESTEVTRDVKFDDEFFE